MRPTTSPPDVDLVDDATSVEVLADDALLTIHEGADEPAPSATWLAAYAMGLVASHQQARAIDLLLAQVPQAGGPARSALRRLEDPTVGDPQLRAAARDLLEAAIAHLEASEPDPS